MLLDFTLGLMLALPADDRSDLVQVEFLLPAERVVPYQGPGELRMVSNLALSDIAQEAFDGTFVGEAYFGAFALSKDGGYGYAVATNSIRAARDMAMGECLALNDSCIVIAEIVPQGFRPTGQGDVTLTPEIYSYYNNPEPQMTAPRAMAISEDGAYSIVWSHPDQASADSTALSQCENNRAAQLPGMSDMPCLLVPGF